MTKYRAKQPEIIVTASVWDPANKLPHIAVAPSDDGYGNTVGSIANQDGVDHGRIVPGSVIVTFEVPEGTAPKYEVYRSFEEFEAFYEPISGKKAKALSAGSSDDDEIAKALKG